MRFFEVRVWGNNQALTGLAETGDLQPLQNLNLLTELDLTHCVNLIGQSVSGFVRAQPTAIFIRSPFLIGTLGPISGLVQLTHLNLYYCRNLTGTICCSETTRLSCDWWTQVNFKHFRT